MRGRRAFLVTSITVLVLGLIVFGIYQLLYENAISQARFRFEDPFSGEPLLLGGAVPVAAISGAVSVQIGQAIFGGLLGVLTLLILMIAPALTSGVVSSEREKQTLELLVTTPISTLGMLVAKLLGSFAYVFLLILASVPLMSIVFAFGGVGPEDVARAYLLIIAVAFGVGSIGMFMSALVGRTQIATVLSYLVVLLLVGGSAALYYWMFATSVQDRQLVNGNGNGNGNAVAERRHAPEPLLWLNPVVADVDIICTAMPDLGGPCSYIIRVRDLPEDTNPPPQDAFWPRTALAFLVLGGTLTVLATQLISPSRGLRSRRRARRVPDGPDETAHHAAS